MHSSNVLDDLFLWSAAQPYGPLKDPGLPSSRELDELFRANLLSQPSSPPALKAAGSRVGRGGEKRMETVPAVLPGASGAKKAVAPWKGVVVRSWTSGDESRQTDEAKRDILMKERYHPPRVQRVGLGLRDLAAA
ncbi:unnamed protein product [Durusdinium trenchii]|uniref:Uncharacterized protein n=2 Tax=Durusdinium trenchii TaxID=1381693 RepID=A0ABP0NPC2_9DINO